MIKPLRSRSAARPFAVGIAVLAGLLMAVSANGQTQLDRTRVIFNAGDRNASLTVTNRGSYPVLIQSWLDDGDDALLPGEKVLPLMLVPPLLRLNPSDNALLKVVPAGGVLPADVESVLWINVQEIPPKAEKNNVLQIAVRSRIKLFYRPKGLAGSSAEAPAQLQWRLHREAQQCRLTVNNPSNFHVTLSELALLQSEQTLAEQQRVGMLSPGGQLQSELPCGQMPDQVRFTIVNDFGGRTVLTSALAN